MTIHSVDKAWSKTGGGGASLNGSTLSLNLTEGYQITHSYDATIDEIMSAATLPQIGNYYPGSSVPCVKVSPPQKIGPIFSIITVDYSAEVSFEPGDTLQSALNKNPLLQPAEIQWDSETTSEEMSEDYNGNPVATFNGEPLFGVSRDLSDTVLIVTKNFPVWNPKVISRYYVATNVDEFATYEPGTVRLLHCPAKRMLDQTYGFYWQATARFLMREPYNTTPDKAWYARVKHEGFLVRTGTLLSDTEHARTIINGEPVGDKVVNPVPISVDDGSRLPDDEYEWKEFQRYGELPYAALGFDVTI